VVEHSVTCIWKRNILLENVAEWMERSNDTKIIALHMLHECPGHAGMHFKFCNTLTGHFNLCTNMSMSKVHIKIPDQYKLCIVDIRVIQQVRTVHVSRVSPANTLKKRKMKVRMSYFRGSVVVHTLEHSRIDQIKYIVGQLQPASWDARGKQSAVLQCMEYRYHITTKVRHVFLSVCRANTVNMNAPSLV
jgi:hypothetical protein